MNFEVTGTWTLSGGGPECHGHLEKSAERDAKLSIYGKFGDLPEPGFGNSQTIWGTTPKGPISLLNALPTSWTDPPIETQTWTVQRVIRGGHIDRTSAFRHFTFKLPGLLYWFGPSPLNYASQRGASNSPVADYNSELTAELHNGATIRLLGTSSRSRTLVNESTEKFAIYVVSKKTGMSLDEIDFICLSFQRLHSLITNEPMSAFDVTMYSETLGDGGFWFEEQDKIEGARWASTGLHDPFFDTSEIGFASFVNKWHNLHQTALVACSAAAPREDAMYLSSRLIQGANGVEALAATRVVPISQEHHLLVAEVEKALEVGEIARDTRKYLIKQLEYQRQGTLSTKLVGLARSLGQESAAWLLGPKLGVWADVVAKVRNSLTHGSQLSDGLSADTELLWACDLSVTVVLRLALLVECGFTNRQGPPGANGEIFIFRDEKIASHPNSNLYELAARLAEYSPYWKQWNQRLHGHSQIK
ncbi:hypothetical protein MLP_07450 [Microlunatus phosphovorus NM-1]|uniref:Uncharacterized protein n=1 Tax=Microlunatus phosphovorus (strain ATCC 700054 / DSM 10555 / JCM 9379 / NBRC 101784 / NCIMB 13414 / VKM Ac-1990 / NM-1) TaxID=1032480 RepID=F5XL71_MICPN|nr:HEPN domain-containing protein [Microlunatus phosphovorus]BAK33759.1 hypothetical protein MLP_07450 [Microlunatus phosphovorus NM-1]